jgi:hypothetical protein
LTGIGCCRPAEHGGGGLLRGQGTSAPLSTVTDKDDTLVLVRQRDFSQFPAWCMRFATAMHVSNRQTMAGRSSFRSPPKVSDCLRMTEPRLACTCRPQLGGAAGTSGRRPPCGTSFSFLERAAPAGLQADRAMRRDVIVIPGAGSGASCCNPRQARPPARWVRWPDPARRRSQPVGGKVAMAGAASLTRHEVPLPQMGQMRRMPLRR